MILSIITSAIIDVVVYAVMISIHDMPVEYPIIVIIALLGIESAIIRDIPKCL